MRTEPKGISPQIIAGVVGAQYKINITEAVLTPGGEVAFAYKLLTPEKAYFLKIYGTSRQAKHALSSLESSLDFLVSLNESRFPWALLPVKSIEGRLYVHYKHLVLVLFPFIPHPALKVPATHLMEQLGGIVATLHNLPIQQYPMLRLFNLDMSFLEEMDSILEEVRDHERLWKLLSPQISALYDRAEFMRKLFLSVDISHTVDQYVTHGDIGNHLIGQNEQVYLVDWDTVALGWRERDLWRFFQKKNIPALREYSKVAQSIVVNPERCRLFLYEKLLRNILNWSWRIMREDFTKEQAEADFTTLKCMLEEERDLDITWTSMEELILWFNYQI